MRRIHGFSLVEIMVALAIVGILAAIAIPNYQESVRRSNRSDAHITLNRFATLQEQYFFRTNQYSADFGDLIDGVSAGTTSVDSEEGHYSIQVSGGGNTWTMTATPQGGQAADTTCAQITLNHLGNETAQDSDGNDTSDECW